MASSVIIIRKSMQQEKRMFRKIVLSFISIVGLFSGSVFAVGLGDIQQNSGLNQPLSAEIPLLSAGDLAEYELLASLASSKEFDKIGVERVFFLNNIKFKTIRDDNGQIVIKVSTLKPVKEPFLNFIIELNWPNGRILREYTLLLDPPVFDDSTSSTIEQAKVDAPEANNQANPEPERRRTPQQNRRPAQSEQSTFTGSSYGPVSNTDTLWSIASRARPDRSVSIHQTLVAIYRANPDAFANGNINNLLEGKVLTIPDATTIQNVPKRAALQDVVMQNREWRSGGARKIVAQGDEQGSSTNEQGDGARLSLGTENNDNNADGYGSDESELNELKDELSKTQEESATLQAENEALRARLAEILANAEQSQQESAIEVNDAELAALGQASAESENKQEPELTDESLTQDEEPILAQESETEQQSNDGIGESNEETLIPTEEQADDVEETQDSAEAQQDTAPPTIFKEKEEGFVDNLLGGGAMMWGGIGLVVILIVMGVFWRMKKRMEEDDFQDDLVASAGAGSMDTTEAFELPDVGDDMLVELDMDDDEQFSAEKTDEAFDPLGEADIYIAYGKHEQAENLLLEAIEDNPVRADIKVKLMECYAESDDQEKFEALAVEVREAVDAEEWQEQVESLRARAWGGGEESIASIEDDFDLPSTEDIFGGDDDDDELDIDFDETIEDETLLESVDEIEFASDDEDSEEFDVLEGLDDLDGGDELDEIEGLNSIDAPNDVDDIDSLDELDDEAVDELDKTFDELGLDIDDDSDIATADEDDFSIEMEDDDESDFSLDVGDDEDLAISFDEGDLDNDDELSLDSDDDFGGDFDFDESDDDDLDFDEAMGEDGDEIATKLDLARAYVDMGDSDGANEILKEVVAEGNTEQRKEAQDLIDKSS
jgi:pilus assembly protein FimV